MSIDAGRFGELTLFLHIVWSGEQKDCYRILYKSICSMIGPFQMVVAFVLLYLQMQWAVIPGVVLLLLLIPLSTFLQKIQKNLTVCRLDIWQLSVL
jgi:hypothetical protein